MDLTELLAGSVDFSDRNLWICVATVVWCPLWWNVVGRIEFRTRFLTNLCGGSARAGIFAMAASILGFGFYRDWRLFLLMNSQPHWAVVAPDELTCKWLGHAIVFVGTSLVLSSCYKLGFYNTFLGDYFGVLMEKKVESFPFSVLNHPMYVGAALNFIGSSISNRSTCGLLMTVLAIVGYVAAAAAEGPFTEQIYGLADQYRHRKLNSTHPTYSRIAEAVRDVDERAKNK